MKRLEVKETPHTIELSDAMNVQIYGRVFEGYLDEYHDGTSEWVGRVIVPYLSQSVEIPLTLHPDDVIEVTYTARPLDEVLREAKERAI